MNYELGRLGNFCPPQTRYDDIKRRIGAPSEGSMGVKSQRFNGEARAQYVAIKFLSQHFKQPPDALKTIVRELARFSRSQSRFGLGTLISSVYFTTLP